MPAETRKVRSTRAYFRRCLLHRLPARLVRIRHFGLLAKFASAVPILHGGNRRVNGTDMAIESAAPFGKP